MNMYGYIHICLYIHVYYIHIYIHILAWHLRDSTHRPQPISMSFLQKRHTIPKSGRFNTRPQTHSNTLQHTATHCEHYRALCQKDFKHEHTLWYVFKRTRTQCNTLQHTATHYNTRQVSFSKDQ